jgi:hypothetical protein
MLLFSLNFADEDVVWASARSSEDEEENDEWVLCLLI